MTADGYLRTGDIARVDERGYVYIVDRKKDMINVSGFNVYPNEVEDVAMGHPGVLEAAAVGVLDARTGEAVKLVVVRKDPTLTEADLVAYCRQHLTGYKTAAAYRVPRLAAAHQCRQDPAPRIARRGPAGRGMTRYRNAGVLTPLPEAPRSGPEECPVHRRGESVLRDVALRAALRTRRRLTPSPRTGQGLASGRAGGVEPVHVGRRQLERGRPDEAVHLLDRGGAGDRRGDGGPA